MSDKENENNHTDLIEKINALSESLGFKNGERTILEIKNTDDPHIKQLILKSGEWGDDKPMFAIDAEDGKRAYAFIPADTFAQIINALKAAQTENFNLKLEKTIWQHVPADFEDVWVVAMDQIKKLTQSQKGNKPISIDLDKLISDIKKEHPNLFINLKDLYAQHPMLGNGS